jgi:hypothetical protein
MMRHSRSSCKWCCIGTEMRFYFIFKKTPLFGQLPFPRPPRLYRRRRYRRRRCRCRCHPRH